MVSAPLDPSRNIRSSVPVESRTANPPPAGVLISTSAASALV
jgi:hypothetical protein